MTRPLGILNRLHQMSLPLLTSGPGKRPREGLPSTEGQGPGEGPGLSQMQLHRPWAQSPGPSGMRRRLRTWLMLSFRGHAPCSSHCGWDSSEACGHLSPGDRPLQPGPGGRCRPERRRSQPYSSASQGQVLPQSLKVTEHHPVWPGVGGCVGGGTWAPSTPRSRLQGPSQFSKG